MHSEELTPVHDSDQEIIDGNKPKLIEDIISNLLILIFGISVVAWIIQVIILLVNFP